MFKVEVLSQAYVDAVYCHKKPRNNLFISIPIFPSKFLAFLRDIEG
jgi:hypothetical protein